jgi:pyridoxamine 5'-phosphate oxidase
LFNLGKIILLKQEMDIHKIRTDYKRDELKDEGLEQNPIVLFRHWFETAVNSDIPDVNAMTLATATAKGLPSARTVLLKGFDEKGFVFYSNYQGRKAIEMEANPNVALLIFWRELERQVRIEGVVEKVTATESDEYFHSRPLESRLSAIVSKQSKPVESRQELERIWVDFLKQNNDKPINRPEYWGGFRVIPLKIEFWQGRPNRLHDRILYSLEGNVWKIERLQP